MNFKEFDDLLQSGAEKIVLDSDVIFSIEDEPEYIRGFKLDVDGPVIDGDSHCIDGPGKALIIDGDTFKSNATHKGSAIYNRRGEIEHGI